MDIVRMLDDAEAPVVSVVKSASRVFEVLELFGRERRQLSAAEIGQALGYPKSSANALLKSLVSLGYLVLDASTLRYFPSLSVTRLGDWIPSVVLAAGDAFEVMAEVNAATQETVTLSVQTDLSVSFLKVISGTFPISLRMKEGLMAPLFSSAVGIAILSRLPDEGIRSLIGRANSRARRKSERVDDTAVMRNVSEARQKGFTVFYDAVFPDTGAIAVPFPSPIEGFPMAIGVGGLRERIKRNEIAIHRAIRASLIRHLGRGYRTRKPCSAGPARMGGTSG
jgi:DNA-binding IclR family transcriptional regulator